jgi:hypothetical protein
MKKKSFLWVEKDNDILDLVHSSIWELNDILTRGYNKYFSTFINDSFRYTYVYLIKIKNQEFEKLNFIIKLEKKIEMRVKYLRSDIRDEYFFMWFFYIAKKMELYFKKVLHKTYNKMNWWK